MLFKRFIPLMLSGVMAVSSVGVYNTKVFAASSQVAEDYVVPEEYDLSDDIESMPEDDNDEKEENIVSVEDEDLFPEEKEVEEADDEDASNDIDEAESTIYATESSDYQYEIIDGTATITKYTGSDTIVNIPSEIDGYPVDAIGNYAFDSCTGLTEITIPDSVTSIGGYAFSCCTSLTSITIPDSVTSIGESAFSCCTSLTSITIPDSVSSIGSQAFYNCTSLMSITIPNSVTSIGNIAFLDCTSLTSITIPNSVTSIGLSAFRNCTSLTSITIPNSVTSIGENPFESCYQLDSIIVEINNPSYDSRENCNAIIDSKTNQLIAGCMNTIIPNSVTSIGSRAFSVCTSLTSITIPDSVTSIDEWAFYYCTSLTSITLPNSVTSIGSRAFDTCTSLTSITIPDSVLIIDSGAFDTCTSLTSITIPDSVTSIGVQAFHNCYSLTSITIPNSVTSIGGWAFHNCYSLTSITIPNSVTSIGESAFKGCKSLTSITIPNSVTSIDSGAFYNCESLKDVYYGGSVEDFAKIIIEKYNESLLNATIHYNSYNPGGGDGETYTITASAGEHGSISPSGNVKVKVGTSQTFVFTPDKDYEIDTVTLDGADFCLNEGIREYTVDDNGEPYRSINVSYRWASNTQEYDKEKLDYKDLTFEFSLSNSENKVEETEYNFDANLNDFFSSSYENERKGDLIKTSIRVAMAAMDPNAYTGTSKRAMYIKNLMKKMDFQFSDEDINYEDPNGDTIGTAIGSRQIQRGDEEFTLVLVAVRGGGYKNEWAGNANVEDNWNNACTTNHNGFDMAANKVVQRIREHLDRHNITDLSNVKIWITGYSRAAAVSNLVAAKLDDGYRDTGIPGISSSNVYAYCFECPKNTLDTNWNDQRYDNIISIVNLVDFIPLVAPNRPGTEWTYNRYGKTLFINDGKQYSEGFRDAYCRMYDEYYDILGTDKSHEDKISRLNNQLKCYETNNRNIDNKAINSQHSFILRVLLDAIDSPEEYARIFQNRLYSDFMTKDDLSITVQGAIQLFATVLLKNPFALGAEILEYIFGGTSFIDINHYPELQLAWIDSFTSVEDYLRLDQLRYSHSVINCPVNVTVRDDKNNVVGQIINNEPVYIEDGIATYIDFDGQKVVLIPSDGNYTIEATAYDDGDVSITTTSYSGESIYPDKVVSFQKIDIKKDETVTAVFSGDTVTVSGTEGNILSPSFNQIGEDIVSHSIYVESDGPGTVEGGGSYFAGEFCQVSAIPDENNYFVGWYENEKLVSTELVYRFAVLKDMSISAVFADSPVNAFSVQFNDTAMDPYEGLYFNPSTNQYETVYKGVPIKPSVVVTGMKGILTEGTDYTLKYGNNTNYNSKGKPATVTVVGKGNYSGKIVLNYYILPVDLEVARDKGLLSVPDEIRVQSGKKVSPIIAYGDYILKAADMNISNKAAIKADTEISISGKGNFIGILENINVKVLQSADVKKFTIKASIKPAKHVYNGEPHELTYATPDTPGELTVTAGSSKIPLVEGLDYTVTYKNNVSAGTATIRIKGVGDYIGEITKTFTIQPDKTSIITAELKDPDATIQYRIGGVKPEIVVTLLKDNGESDVLTAGKDYAVSYANNAKVGTGKYTVSFIGNYKGHAAIKNKTFAISAAPFEAAKAYSADMIYSKPGKYLSAPYVSINNVQLSTKDYTVKYYDGDNELTSKSKLTLAGDTQTKEITVKVTGKGNYQAQEITTTYFVRKQSTDVINLSKTKIVALDKDKKGKDVAVGKQEYTGRAVKPAVRVLAKYGKVWKEVPSTSYSVKYVNNVNRGKATILITGDGVGAVGSIKTTFTIGQKSFSLFSWLFGL